MNRIKKYRQSIGLTLEETAELVGSSKNYIWQLENKDNPSPNVHLGIKLARAFGISTEHLFPTHDSEKG